VDLPEEFHSPDEAAAAFERLTREERNKLARAASFLAGSSGFPAADDLINEAYIRIAGGTRRWPREHEFLPFVAGVMRSLRSDKAFLTDERKVVQLNQGFAIVNSDDLGQVSANDDDSELARKVIVEDAIVALETHFADDEEMLLLIMGIQERLKGKDLQEAIGVDATRLEALRTRLNRKIDKLADQYRLKEGRS